MVALLELIWGPGYMAPGGEGNVLRMVRGLDLEGARVLDIGCGIGGPACLLAGRHGARVVGIDLEAPLVERARRRARELGVDGRAEFRVVEPGPLAFPDARFDLVLSSGALTQTPDKPAVYRECLRVLAPGGWLSTYDWMKPPGDYSPDMRAWFELEGLSYHMDTPADTQRLLCETGFEAVRVEDRSPWYRRRVRQEYEALRGELYPRAVELLGRAQADHFVEDWRVMARVCEKGEMLQVYSRGRRPA